MPLAVTHVILAIVAISLYRDYVAKKKFHRGFVVVGGVAGLLPDLDVPVDWILTLLLGHPVSFHRVFTHSLLWPALLFAVALYFRSRRNSVTVLRYKFPASAAATFFAVVAFGWLFHLLLDCAVVGDDNITLVPLLLGFPFCIHWLSSEQLAGLDAAILILWLVHEEVKHRIRDYI